MKVRELIRKLRRMPPGAEVIAHLDPEAQRPLNIVDVLKIDLRDCEEPPPDGCIVLLACLPDCMDDDKELTYQIIAQDWEDYLAQCTVEEPPLRVIVRHYCLLCRNYEVERFGESVSDVQHERAVKSAGCLHPPFSTALASDLDCDNDCTGD